MVSILSLSWCAEEKEKMDAFLNHTIDSYELTTAVSKAINFAVLCLLKKNISYKILNMGGGVKRITTKTDTCPKCKGLGKC
ncbi:MAG: hypothetical protein RLY43_2161 [Bacteroidota bacterium]|jgi:hypothetical protein